VGRDTNVRRAVFFIFAALCFLALSDPAFALDRTYQDPLEGTVNALDVTTVVVSDSSPGNFIVDITTPNYQNITTGDEITVYLNTDGNRANNDGGAEYALFIAGTTTCGLYVWNGANYVLVRSLSCPFFYGPTFTFSRADVGSPPQFEFWIRTEWTPTGESDRAPDSGWWLFDPTPPETTITGGPSGSTTDRNASLTFTSNEGGSTFQCSLDGSAFSACASPASYQNLAFAGHTFRVRARDPSGNFDLTPAARVWTVVDGTPPTATAGSGKCCVAGQAEIRYTIADNTGSAAAEVSIYRLGRSKPSKVCSYEIDRARPDTYVARCALPKSARGWIRFCVLGQDAAGLRSKPSCRRLKFGRLNADVAYEYDRIGSSVRLTRFALFLGGGRASIGCRGCSGRPVRAGTTVSPGGRIEVRVIKPRVRGTYIRLTNTGGSLRRSKACLPPGLAGPVVPCSRTS
jgi:hypothetical protein